MSGGELHLASRVVHDEVVERGFRVGLVYLFQWFCPVRLRDVVLIVERSGQGRKIGRVLALPSASATTRVGGVGVGSVILVRSGQKRRAGSAPSSTEGLTRRAC